MIVDALGKFASVESILAQTDEPTPTGISMHLEASATRILDHETFFICKHRPLRFRRIRLGQLWLNSIYWQVTSRLHREALAVRRTDAEAARVK